MTGSMNRLTSKQLEALLALSAKPRSVWDFGSTTVAVLRAEQLILTAQGTATITAAGRDALRGRR